jgi:hypothetical protein
MTRAFDPEQLEHYIPSYDPHWLRRLEVAAEREDRREYHRREEEAARLFNEQVDAKRKGRGAVTIRVARLNSGTN